MDFSYQNYVKKLVYKPYDWPPNISLAGLHSRCSQPGKQNPVGVACPCCGYKIKNKIDSWIKKDIYDDFKQTGAGVPTYFGLLRFYNLVVVLIFLVNAPYFTYAATVACHRDKTHCVNIGSLYYIDFKSMVRILNTHGQHQIVNVLMVLQTMVFYILLVANNLSIFYIAYISRKCKDVKKSTKRFMTLLVENIPDDTSEEALRLMMVLPDGKNPRISSITFVKELRHFDKLFVRRILAFFELKALYIECIDPKKQFQKNKALKALDDEYQQISKVENLRQIKAMVMFEDHDQLMQIVDKYQFSEVGHWWERALNRITKNQKKTDIFVHFMPQLDETLWVNLGEDHKVKMISKVKAFLITLVLLTCCYVLFYYPLRFSLGVHSSMEAKLTLAQKFLPTLIALALVVLSIIFRYYMEVLGKKRCPRTALEQSQFVLICTVMFHLIFYLLVPTFFFLVDNGISQSVKLFAISSQARTFIFIQLILSSFDSVFRLWRMKKMKSLADQRESFKYPQKYLHQKVQYRDYPIQIKLIVMFKIWSLVLFYSFFVPVITLYVMVALVALYFLQKRNIYQHYVIRKHLSSKLQIRFLNIYINFFCIYECLIYFFNVNSTWQKVAALVSTLASLLLQLFYWQFLKKREQKKHQHKIQIAKNEIKHKEKLQKSKAGLNEELLESEKEFDSEEDEQDDPSYGSVYNHFLEEYHQPELDKEIREYLMTTSMNLESEVGRVKKEEKVSIEMISEREGEQSEATIE